MKLIKHPTQEQLSIVAMRVINHGCTDVSISKFNAMLRDEEIDGRKLTLAIETTNFGYIVDDAGNVYRC